MPLRLPGVRATATAQPGEWSGPRPFVGREAVLGQLDAALETALRGTGVFVVLQGPDGSGRAALARRFTRLAAKRHRNVRSAIGDAADPEHPAFRQLAMQFTARRRVGAALRRSSTEWLGAVVPVIGNVLAAIVETVQTLRRTQDSAYAPTGTGSTIDQVRLLLTFGGSDPRILVLENLERSDPDELAGAFALVQRLRETHTLFIGTSIATAGRLPDAVRDLVREAERLGIGRVVQIPALTDAEAAAAVEEALARPLPPAWQDWFRSAAPATPTELWTILGELERDGHVQRVANRWVLADSPPAARASAAEHAGQAGLSAEERDLIAAAALCGPVFRLDHVAGVVGWSELRTEDLLARLVRRELVRLVDTVEDGGELVDVFAFETPAAAARWAALADASVRARARSQGMPGSNDATGPAV